MTRNTTLALILAVVAALMLCACGDAVELSSDPEGIATFGMDVDPSAQPSTPQNVPPQGVTSTSVPVPAGSGGALIENNSGFAPSPSPSPAAVEPVATLTPVTTPDPTASPYVPAVSPDPSETPEPSPAISPPAPASTATVDEAMAYIGRPVRELIDALGYPTRSDYEDVDEGNPETDRLGTLYFDGYVVTTLRTQEEETVTGVTPVDPEPEVDVAG